MDDGEHEDEEEEEESEEEDEDQEDEVMLWQVHESVLTLYILAMPAVGLNSKWTFWGSSCDCLIPSEQNFIQRCGCRSLLLL